MEAASAASDAEELPLSLEGVVRGEGEGAGEARKMGVAVERTGVEAERAEVEVVEEGVGERGKEDAGEGCDGERGEGEDAEGLVDVMRGLIGVCMEGVAEDEEGEEMADCGGLVASAGSAGKGGGGGALFSLFSSPLFLAELKRLKRPPPPPCPLPSSSLFTGVTSPSFLSSTTALDCSALMMGDDGVRTCSAEVMVVAAAVGDAMRLGSNAEVAVSFLPHAPQK